MKELNAFKAFLASPKKIVITTHANPDADALGSSLGLWHFLKRSGHEAWILSPTDYPDFLKWMPGQEEVLVYDEQKEAHRNLIQSADLICCLDFSDLKRIKKLEEPVRQAPAAKLLIDHHLNPDQFAQYELWDHTAAATAELVYDLIVMLNGEALMTKDLAECLYAGIMTDTGSFRHNSTSAKVHRTVAHLMDHGADVNKISRLIYDTNSLDRLRFLGYALMEKLTVLEEWKVGYFVINEAEHKRFRLKSGDTEGLVNYALSINGMKMAAIIMQRDGEVKLSFRSVDTCPVNDFAAQHFNGGGHRNAAGGLSHLSIEDTLKKFLELVPGFMTSYLSKTQ